MDNLSAAIAAHFAEGRDTFSRLSGDDELIRGAAQAAARIKNAFSQGGRLYIAGNGGSAADAQHFAAELVGWYHKGDKPLPAIALTTDTSFLTAWGNDDEYANVFVRQLKAHARSGDVFFGISTSGNSPNVVLALEAARALGVATIALLSAHGGTAVEYADIALRVPAHKTPLAQEAHIAVIHAICTCLSAP